MTSSISEAEFEVLCKRLPITLTPAQKAELYQAYGHIEKLREQLRKPRSFTAEPAHMFTVVDKGASDVG